MKLTTFKTGEKPQGHMVEVTNTEAMRLIESLAKQIYSDSPNIGRQEFRLPDGGYFSMAVVNTENAHDQESLRWIPKDQLEWFPQDSPMTQPVIDEYMAHLGEAMELLLKNGATEQDVKIQIGIDTEAIWSTVYGEGSGEGG